MKRVLLTVHKFFPEHRAGTEVLTLKVAQELKRRGYQVSVLTANPPDFDARRKHIACDVEELVAYEFDGIAVYSLSEGARLKNSRFTNEHYNPYLKRHYKKIFDLLAPELVHCFHLQNLSSSLLEEAYARKTPVIYSATDFWLICPIVQLRRPEGTNCLGPAPLAVNCLSCYTPKLMPEQAEVIEAVGDKYQSFWQRMKRLPGVIYKLIASTLYFAYLAKKIPGAVHATMERPAVLKYFSNKLSAITVPTCLMQDLFIRSGIKRELIHHIPYGIDTGPLEKGRQKTKSENLRIAFIGAIAEHKGPDLLIKAFLQLPENSKVSLTLYGDLKQFPQYGKYLQELLEIDSPLVKKIILAGTFPNDQIGNIFQEIDVLVVPSRWYENTPLVIQSALAAKTPIIATNLGGMSELIKHGENGLLFEVDNDASLAQQLSKLINDKLLLAKLANNIKPERTIAQMVDSLEKLYIRHGLQSEPEISDSA